MKLIFIDKEAGELKVEPKNLEDLWYLSMLVREGDIAEGRSFRRFKTENEGERAKSGEKKPVRIAIKVTAVEFAEAANKLRLTGKILSGEPAELVQVGSFHTIDVEPNHPIKITKKITAYDLEILDEAKKSAVSVKAAILAIDERKATFSVVSKSGIRHIAEIESGASKRNLSSFDNSKKEFFGELYNMLANSDFEIIIVAGPGFAKDEFAKYLQNKDAKMHSKLRLEHSSTAERNAAAELLKRGALERVLDAQRVSGEFAMLEKLKLSLAKDDGMAVYGISEVEDASQKMAIGTLMVIDELARNNKRAGGIMSRARTAKVPIIIFNSADEAGMEFKTFQIAALLRYRMKFD